jgi:nucleotide-binding universal stress UspA family protein
MYQRILVPIDGSATSMLGLDEAIRLARLTGGQIRLLNLVEDPTLSAGYASFAAYSGEVLPMLRQAGEEILEKGRATALAAGVAVDTQLFEGLATRLSEAVEQEVARWGADLVVLGTHGRRGASRFFLGSDAEQVLRSSPVPVLLVRATEAAKTAA